MAQYQPKYSRPDSNQVDIATAFRGLGASVVDVHLVGGGVPDLIVGIDSVTLLVEVKRPPGPRGGMDKRNLTHGQIDFRKDWRGAPPHTVRTLEDVGVLVAAVRAGETARLHRQNLALVAVLGEAGRHECPHWPNPAFEAAVAAVNRA